MVSFARRRRRASLAWDSEPVGQQESPFALRKQRKHTCDSLPSRSEMRRLCRPLRAENTGNTVSMRVSVSILAALYLAGLVTGALSQSITTDEGPHLAAGLSIVQLNQFGLYAVNPPLVKMLVALPVSLMDPVTDWNHSAASLESRNEFPVGVSFIEQNADRSLLLFRAARLACLPFGLLGFWICFRWGRDLHGERGGLLAAALWSLSPLILGHGSLITPDVPAAATGILAIYRFRIWLNATTLWNATWLGIFTGIALLTKFTWSPLFPVIGLIGWIFWRAVQCYSTTVLRRDIAQLFLTCVASLYVINALYGFDHSFKKLGEYEFISTDFTRAADENSSAPTANLTASLESIQPVETSSRINSENRVNRFRDSWLGTIPVPLPELYLQGIDLQRRDFEPKQRGKSYLMGEWKDGGWWYYYLVGLFIKEPLAGLILLAVASLSLPLSLFVTLRRKCLTSVRSVTSVTADNLTSNEKRFDVPLREYVILLLPAVLVFALVSWETGFNHHVRYIIPALPFLFVMTSRLAVYCDRSRFCRYVVLMLLAWQFSSVLWYRPHWMSYFNEIAGGPENGDQWLLSSNIDWGQDFLHLKAWQEQHPEATPLFTILNTRYTPTVFSISPQLPEFLTQPPEGITPGQPSPPKTYHPQTGWYAISVTALYGARGSVYSPDPGTSIYPDRIAWFRNQTPVDRAGYSMRIYRVVSDDISTSARLQERGP